MNCIDYRAYSLSKKEYVFYGLLGAVILLIFSHLFYHSLIPTIFLIPCFFMYFKQLRLFLYGRRREKLSKQFMDSIVSISTSLETGSSIENAVWDAYLQISVIYSRNAYMSLELYAIYNQLKLSIPIEEAFSNLAVRTDVADILTFCDILRIAKRTDGNLVSIIRATSGTIGEKFNIRREIRTNINGKKLEQLVMVTMPVLIIIYIKLTSPDFFNPIYHNIPGIIFSTVCLGIYGFSVLLAMKISTIEV